MIAAIERIEHAVDKIAVKSGIDISLMRRGLYPIPGPYHLNLKSKNINPLEKDLLPETASKIYDQALEILYSTRTLDKANLKPAFLRSYEDLVSRSKQAGNIENIIGHESLLSFSKEQFINGEDYSISFYVNKALGEAQALPFMIKLSILQQNLEELHSYISLKDNKKDYIDTLVFYALNHERINITRQKLRVLEKRNHIDFYKAKKKEELLKQIDEYTEKEKQISHTDLHFGQLALYFLSDNDSREARDIRKWVDSHTEYETYRSMMAYGINECVKGSKKGRDMIVAAIDYAIFSKNSCAFVERIYNNKFQVYRTLVGHDSALIEKGQEYKHKRKRLHRLKINGSISNLISYEEFEQNYVPEMSKLGINVSTNAHSITLDLKNIKNAIDMPGDFSTKNIDTSAYKDLTADDAFVGSMTNTISLYGSAIVNAFLGSFISWIKPLPFLRPIAKFLNSKIAIVDNEVPMLAFSAKAGIKNILRYNKHVLTGSLYEYKQNDLIAETLANKIVESKAYFSSHYTLNDTSEKHSLESLLEVSNGTDFIKDLLLTLGITLAVEHYVDFEHLLYLPNYISVIPIFFCSTWATFSGWLEKPVLGLSAAAKYAYKKNFLNSALESFISSPLA